MDGGPQREDTGDDLQLDELLPWMEFACWTAIAIFPFLSWINGPAVSTDQYVMRNILIVLAFVGAFGLRYWNYQFRRQAKGDGSAATSEIVATNADDVVESSQ